MHALTFALAQINPTVGDIAGNARKILEYWKKAKGSDLVIFSELVLCGYPPEDLILKPAFMDAIELAVQNLCKANIKTAGLIGTPWRVNDHIYNAALLIENGTVQSVTLKHHLPDYGVFDEKRIFSPGPLPQAVSFRGHKLGIMICEDMWFADTAAHLKAQGAEILIVPNGSPFEIGKDAIRKTHAKARVQETGLPLLYVNQVGGQDELVFDGGSFGMDAKGQITKQFPFFEEATTPAKNQPAEMELIYNALKLGLHDYVRKNGFSKVLLGLSGGVDSALVAVIAVDALGAENVECFMLPSRYTSKDSLDDAAELAKILGVSLETYSIEEPLKGFENTLPDLKGLAHENIQSRIRGTMLMALSNARGSLLLSTGNKSEMACGYATLYGDMNGAFNPLKDVYKTLVYELCEWRNIIPERILTKAPTAELRDNQTDQDSLPPYDILDDILKGLIEDDLGIQDIKRDKALVQRVWKMLDQSEYKRRQSCPGVKITSKAFSRDRRIPMTNRFQQ